MYVILSLIPRALAVGFSIFVISVAALSPQAFAQSAGDTMVRDCDNNAVLRCGGYSTGEIAQKYQSQSGAKTIFHHFGIKEEDIANLGSTAVNGFVTKDGRVLIDDKTVATDAKTAGRQNMPGSQAVTVNGTTFYTRPTSASFSQDRLAAYIVMKDGQFQFAIIKSCGNPVSATPTVAPTTPSAPSTPAPSAPAPAPAPTPTVTPSSPSTACNSLDVTVLDDGQVSSIVTGTTVDGTITGFVIDYADGTPPSTAPIDDRSESTETINSVSITKKHASSDPVTHQYAKSGSFTVTAAVQVQLASGNMLTVPSDTCKDTVTIEAPATVTAAPTTTPTPATSAPETTTPTAPTTEAPAPAPTPTTVDKGQPTPLPNTGMNVSQVLGLAALIGIESSLGYFWFMFWRQKII